MVLEAIWNSIDQGTSTVSLPKSPQFVEFDPSLFIVSKCLLFDTSHGEQTPSACLLNALYLILLCVQVSPYAAHDQFRKRTERYVPSRILKHTIGH